MLLSEKWDAATMRVHKVDTLLSEKWNLSTLKVGKNDYWGKKGIVNTEGTQTCHVTEEKWGHVNTEGTKTFKKNTPKSHFVYLGNKEIHCLSWHVEETLFYSQS
jgi:hypothetical protein